MTKSPEPISITLALKWQHQAQFAGIYSAIEEGFYADRNIDVSLVEFSGPTPPYDLVDSGVAQFGITSSNEFLTNYSNNQDIVALAATYQSSPYVLVSLKGSNIISPRSLTGKSVGVKGGASSEGATVLDLLLISAGLQNNEIDRVYLDFSTDERDDLLNEIVDVIGLYRTRLYQFEKEGIALDVIYPEQFGTPVYNDIIFTKKDWVSENNLATKAFMEATLEGWEFALENQQTAVSHSLKYVTNQSYEEPGYQQYILQTSKDIIKPSSNFIIGTMTTTRWQRLQDALIQRGVIPEKISSDDYFTNEYLVR